MCVCVYSVGPCVHESVCMCVDQRSSSLSGWALCFDFFSSSLRSNASPLSYAARTSLEGLQSLSPSTYESPPPFTLPQLPPLPPSSRHLLATCADLLVLSFVPHSHSCEFAMLRVRLDSGHCPFYQPSTHFNALFIWLWHSTHTQTHTLCFLYFVWEEKHF